jgi:hypothetical protein
MKNLVRDWIIIIALVLVAFLAKMEAINGIIAIGVGIWSMVKLFKLFFMSGEESEEVWAGDFIPRIHRQISNILSGHKCTQNILILLWWILGIGIMFGTFKTLTALFISP